MRVCPSFSSYVLGFGEEKMAGFSMDDDDVDDEDADTDDFCYYFQILG